MDKTEITGTMPPPLTPIQMASVTMKNLSHNISNLKGNINFKFKRHEERIIMLDKQKSALMRPNLLVASDTGAPYQKAFGAYLRRGDEAGLCAMDLDSKGMSSLVNGDGGYLVDPQIALAVQSVLREADFIRKISNIVNV